MAKTKSKKQTLGRHDLPVSLPGATQFSDDRDVLSPLQIVRLLKQHPDIIDELIDATGAPSNEILVQLALLELDGRAAPRGGGRYGSVQE